MVSILDNFKAILLKAIQQFVEELHHDLLTASVSVECLQRTRRQQAATAATRVFTNFTNSTLLLTGS